MINTLLCSLLVLSQAVFDIADYGAVPYSDTAADHVLNKRAIELAFAAASLSEFDRVVRLPPKTYYTLPVRFDNCKNVSLLILGKMIAAKRVEGWPRQPEIHDYYEDYISFHNCSHIEISGGGRIDGRGYHWWMLLFLNDKKWLPNENSRPHLLRFVDTNFTKIHDLILRNSPQFHIKMDNCHDGELFNLDIRVNTTAQFNIIKQFSVEGVIPMFPFNTDGIDPSGARFHIYNLTVQNWDDVVVPKPQHASDCTRDFLIQNITVILGVGVTVGSVPPELTINCVKNITFRNINMKRPLKGIYIKTNPGQNGTGIIKNIFYYNVSMDRPIWWAIYIGPQQMKEPDGDGPGCMLYPFDRKGTCSTQPLVDLTDVTLQNITIHNSLLYPYTIRCNISNPCKNIVFKSVVTDSWRIGQPDKGYVCQFATGKREKTIPPIHCLDSNDEGNEGEDFSMATQKPSLQKMAGFLLKQMEQAVREFSFEEEDEDELKEYPQ